MRAGTCRSCGASIVWIPMPGGKAMPCDTAPVYYVSKPKSGSKRIVTPNGEVLAAQNRGNAQGDAADGEGSCEE